MASGCSAFRVGHSRIRETDTKKVNSVQTLFGLSDKVDIRLRSHPPIHLTRLLIDKSGHEGTFRVVWKYSTSLG